MSTSIALRSTFKMWDVARLRPHPEVAKLHRWSPASEQFNALARDIELRGIDVPLFVTADGQILDGVTRWRAAQALELMQVPCIMRSEREVLTLALHSIAGRRHYSQGARAYISIPLLGDIDAGKKKRAANLKQGSHFPRKGVEP